MSCGRLFWFTNVTRPPTATVTSAGTNALLDPITTVAVKGGGPGVGVGWWRRGRDRRGGVPPPQPTQAAIRPPHDQLTRRTTPMSQTTSPRSQKNFREMLNPEVPIVVVEAPARHLPECRRQAVREVQLKQVAAGALLDAEAGVRHARVVAGDPGRALDENVDGAGVAEGARQGRS